MRGRCPYNRKILCVLFITAFSVLILTKNLVKLSSPFPIRHHTDSLSMRPKYSLIMEWQRPFKRNGLGNQLFWLAALLGIAYRNNLVPVVPDYSPMNTVFPNHSAKVVSGHVYDWMVLNATDLPEHQVYSKICCIYLPFTEKIKDYARSDIILRGSFQSYKYFHPSYEEVLRRKLAFDVTLEGRAQQILGNTINDYKKKTGSAAPLVTIGIHVRRGDIEKSHLKHFGYTLAPKTYFDNARRFMEGRHKSILYIVASNDLVWVRSAIQGTNVVYLDGQNAETTMAVMTKMSHLIISVGTFSWWIAYLSKAVDVVYFNGTPQAGSFHDVTFRAEDYWLPEWIPLN